MTAKVSRRRLFAFVKNRDGAAAVEFAFVALPLFWMIFGMLEFGVLSLVQSTLDNAVSEVGREIRTGVAQAEGTTKAEMESRVCARMNEIMTLTCGGYLYLDVDRYDSFADVGTGTPTNGGAMDLGQLGYTPGAANEVILVRAYYQWKIVTPFFAAIFANMADGKRLVVSSMMFRNEPF